MTTLKHQAKLDLQRFSKLHLWFKLLPLEGKNFIIFPWKGEQPKNYINPETDVNDTEYHWHFWESERIEEIPISGIGKDIIMRRLVNFNSFLWGVQYSNDGDIYTRGWSIMTRKTPKLEKYLRKKYKDPSLKIVDIIKIENEKQISEGLNKIYEIVDEMTEFCPELLGLPYNKKLSNSDPTHQICKNNLKLNFSSEMIETSSGEQLLQIKRIPENEDKNKIDRSSPPQPRPLSSPRKLMRKLSFRDVKSNMKSSRRKNSH